MLDNIKGLFGSNNDLNDFLPEFVNGMPGGFFIYRADGDEEILYINDAMLGIFGCDTYDEFVELTGNTFKGIVVAEDIDEVEESIAHQISENKNKLDFVEYRINHKDGKTHWVADYGHFIQTNIGPIFYVFISDNTERIRKRMAKLEKMNDELMRISVLESQYRRALLHDALFFYEVSLTEDNFTTTITQNYDRHSLNVFNIANSSHDMTYSEFIRICSEQINRSDPEEYIKFFDTSRLIDCFNNGELEQTYDSYSIDAHGHRRILHYIVLLGGSDTKVTALVLAKDITEQVEHQRLLQATLRQAQAASIAKSTFLTSVSHDIRTPLNAIIGSAELIQAHIDDREKTADYLEKIKLSGNQLLNIVNEALEVTRMESGGAVLAETQCHLIDLLAEVEKAVIPQMNSKSIKFNVDKSGIKHFSVYTDVIRIKEILCQILDNAAKFTPSKGEVVLSVDETDIPGGYGKYCFEVSDTGSGIPDELIEHIYEPFLRGQNAVQICAPGSGLGLTVVHGLVELMNGRIDVESTVGRGTRIKVTVILKQIENILSGSSEPISLNGKRILLVEDNEINREIAETLLTEENFIVETASDGDVAIKLIKDHEPGHYDIVLMDIQMPNMDGYEAARAIRGLKDPQRAEVPIIALSANAYSEDLKRSIEAGMDAHASKPINMTNLQNVISDVLNTRRLLEESRRK